WGRRLLPSLPGGKGSGRVLRSTPSPPLPSPPLPSILAILLLPCHLLAVSLVPPQPLSPRDCRILMCSNAALTSHPSRCPFAAEAAIPAALRPGSPLYCLRAASCSLPTSRDMWRGFIGRASTLTQLRRLNLAGGACPGRPSPLSSTVCGSPGASPWDHAAMGNAVAPCRWWFLGERLGGNGEWEATSCGLRSNLVAKVSDVVCRYRGFASVAEEVSPTDAEEEVPSIEGLQELLAELSKEGSRSINQDGSSEGIERMSLPSKPLPEQKQPRHQQQQKQTPGMGHKKYFALRRRQIQIETEAWEQAAKEYRELLMDMCEQKLAPNLPYMKSLFLGWFEPLRDRILEEQRSYKEGKNKAAYASYFDQLPAEMMSVITMHKVMGLLMTGGGDGSTRVIQAACQVGEAVEQEVRIQRFFEKTKKKTGKNKGSDCDEEDAMGKEQQMLRKKVTQLMKKQKLPQVQKILKQQDNLKPWGQDTHAKVGSRLIELLIDTAYIQPPVNQQADGPPDIRPAFRHTLRTVSKEQQKGSRRYGVIECDPLVKQGLDRTVSTARHMVIPYMPMLVPPVNWTGYDKGAHLFLPSYIMRTHGSRQQREAVKRAPKNQMQAVYEALDTLGTTKWRINKRVLSIVDRIWSSGGRLADLVDREDVPLPEKPETEDEAVIKKWKWKMKSAKKENSERHSLRCDVELKLAVARKMKDEEGFYYPHNLDFRGRAYPMHPYLNHLGSDLCRGILEFSEGRPLGESGLRWLKIHLANLYAGGVDKLSYDGRLAFTESHLEDIFDSADRPLEGKRWWLGAEDPFQCLAVCINLAEALRSSSPETTISHIPVHQGMM
ncbi:hypothetical protein Taro_045922, partial [Colocasia esculenta]|nr:hypothetical protein [Colocasia esculenta]